MKNITALLVIISAFIISSLILFPSMILMLFIGLFKKLFPGHKPTSHQGRVIDGEYEVKY